MINNHKALYKQLRFILNFLICQIIIHNKFIYLLWQIDSNIDQIEINKTNS